MLGGATTSEEALKQLLRGTDAPRLGDGHLDRAGMKLQEVPGVEERAPARFELAVAAGGGFVEDAEHEADLLRLLLLQRGHRRLCQERGPRAPLQAAIALGQPGSMGGELGLEAGGTATQV